MNSKTRTKKSECFRPTLLHNRLTGAAAIEEARNCRSVNWMTACANRFVQSICVVTQFLATVLLSQSAVETTKGAAPNFWPDRSELLSGEAESSRVVV